MRSIIFITMALLVLYSFSVVCAEDVGYAINAHNVDVNELVSVSIDKVTCILNGGLTDNGDDHVLVFDIDSPNKVYA